MASQTKVQEGLGTIGGMWIHTASLPGFGLVCEAQDRGVGGHEVGGRMLTCWVLRVRLFGQARSERFTKGVDGGRPVAAFRWERSLRVWGSPVVVPLFSAPPGCVVLPSFVHVRRGVVRLRPPPRPSLVRVLTRVLGVVA